MSPIVGKSAGRPVSPLGPSARRSARTPPTARTRAAARTRSRRRRRPSTPAAARALEVEQWIPGARAREHKSKMRPEDDGTRQPDDCAADEQDHEERAAVLSLVVRRRARRRRGGRATVVDGLDGARARAGKEALVLVHAREAEQRPLGE